MVRLGFSSQSEGGVSGCCDCFEDDDCAGDGDLDCDEGKVAP